jgi:hypothetical protein
VAYEQRQVSCPNKGIEHDLYILVVDDEPDVEEADVFGRQ